jgi:ribokinase
MKKIVVVGSLNADFVVTTAVLPREGETVLGKGFSVFPGGKGANQSVGIARLGGPVTHIGKVGTDPQARLLRESLGTAGVDLSGLIEDPSVPTGVAFIQVADTGTNSIVVVPGANMLLSPSDLQPFVPLLKEAGTIVLQNEIPLETSIAAARIGKEAGATVLYNPAPFQKGSDQLCGLADLVVPNEIELADLTGLPAANDEAVRTAAEAFLSKYGPRAVVVTLGAKGCLVMDREGAAFVPSFPVVARDTTAAGDAFVAGLVVSLAEGKNLREAARFATRVAAYAVTLPGAQSSLPARADLDRFFVREA